MNLAIQILEIGERACPEKPVDAVVQKCLYDLRMAARHGTEAVVDNKVLQQTNCFLIPGSPSSNQLALAAADIPKARVVEALFIAAGRWS